MADSQRAHTVATYYDRLAPVYGEGEFSHVRRSVILQAIAAELDRVHTVLDLGCGNGTFTAEFAARPTIQLAVGADLSPAMLEAAHQRLGARAALVRADATALPFRAVRFDMVFMSHVLMLVGDIDRCLAEIARLLVPGGILVATIDSGGWRKAIRRLLGPDAPQMMETLFASERLPSHSDDAAHASTASAQVGLLPEVRHVPFTASWPAVEEWVRLRWFTVAHEDRRAAAESLLVEAATRASNRALEFTETLLVARKPEPAA